jgi:cell wall-associated NlpC family hydrolase
MPVTPTYLVNVTRSFIGVPYLHQGRNRNGTDCIGLIILAIKTAKLLPQDFDRPHGTDYGRDGYGNLETIVSLYCQPTPEPIVGSLLLFKAVPRQTIAQHCAICSQWGNSLGMIHAYENGGGVREHELIEFWRDRLVGVYKLPNVEYTYDPFRP